jgi:hypothetical protein
VVTAIIKLTRPTNFLETKNENKNLQFSIPKPLMSPKRTFPKVIHKYFQWLAHKEIEIEIAGAVGRPKS